MTDRERLDGYLKQRGSWTASLTPAQSRRIRKKALKRKKQGVPYTGLQSRREEWNDIEIDI